MSTRYSTHFPAPFGERAIEINLPAQREPADVSKGKQGVVTPGLDNVAVGNAGRAIRRPLNDQLNDQLNDHETTQPLASFRLTTLKPRVNARDLMKPCVQTLRPEDSIERAAQLLTRTDCGLVPVADGSRRLIGIITARDITAKLIALGASIPHAQVSDCMTREAFACSADSSLESCLSAMSWHQLNRIPIVDDEHRIVGTLSRSDLARYVCDHPQKVEQHAIADVLLALAC